MKKFFSINADDNPPPPTSTYELGDVLQGFVHIPSPSQQPSSAEILNPNLLKQFIDKRPRSQSVLNTIATLKSLPLSALVQDGFTILHIAIWREDTEHAKSLILNGASVNEKNHKGESPLHLAVFTGNYTIAQLLIEHDADLEARDFHDQTPLHVASFLEYTDLVTLLVQHGANIEATSHQLTALHLAARWGRAEVVYELLNLGADVNVIDKTCWTPLHKAAWSGLSVEVVKHLIHKGADIMAKNKGDMTPYELAKWEGHKEIAEVIKKEAEKQGKNVESCYMQ